MEYGIDGGHGKTEGSGYVVTENMFIENMFLMVSAEGAAARNREAFGGVFELMDLDGDGKVSKKEHRRFYEAIRKMLIRMALLFRSQQWIRITMGWLHVMNMSRLLWIFFTTLLTKQSQASISLARL